MRELIFENFTIVLAFAAVLFFVPLELMWPRISAQKNWTVRIPTIFAIGLVSVITGIVVSKYAQTEIVFYLKQIQIFSLAKSGLHPIVIFLMAFLFSDFLIFTLHWLSHKINFLWRIHSIHHSDENVTAITGYLHHPLEVIASYLFMMVFFVVLGIPIIVVAIYVAVNAVHNIFTHADIAIPKKLDAILRLIIVTPDMHRTHHSIDMREGNSNFGQIFSFWDRLFRTYVSHPANGEDHLVMGLPDKSTPSSFSFLKLIAYPFSQK